MKMTKMMVVMMMAMMMGVALGDIVTESCKQTDDYNLCVSLLRSDPHSSSANLTGLSLTLVDKVKVHAIKTLEYINKVYKAKPMLREPLGKCNKIYKRMISREVEEAIDAIKTISYPANTVDALCWEASFCEEEFAKGQSPLATLSERMAQICAIAVSVAGLIR